MQKVNRFQSKWRYVLSPALALLVLAADQLSKTWIRTYPEGQPLFEAGFFRIIHINNTGAAFGLFRGQSFILTIVATVGVTLLLLYAFFAYRRFPYLDSMLNRTAIGLTLGGAIGNLIDRLRFGYVTDFFSVGIWPSFNIADPALTIGAILFAYSIVSSARAEKDQDGQGI